MPKDQVEWVSLEDVMAAADRGLAPLGPELAGFVVLETTARARELGGVVDASRVAIGTSGHVALTAPPARGGEIEATLALRQTLSELLAVTSSTTPALRACAKRREGMSLGMIARELEGALIPLNRAASRRGIARVARATLEALANGLLPEERVAREISEPPARVAHEQPKMIKAETPAPPTPAPVVVAPTPAPPTHVEMVVNDSTPYAAPVYEPTGTPPMALAHLPPELEDDDDSEIEIVSNLPPLVAETHPFEPAEPEAPKQDRVRDLLESFEVSRRRDDRALAGDLKAMVGIETSMPPAVTVNVKVRQPSVILADDIAIDHEPLIDEPATHTPVPPPARKRSSFLAFIGLAMLGAIVTAGVMRPSTLDVVFGRATPPGEDKGTTASTVVEHPAMPAMKAPATCEGTLIVEAVPAGAEVLRRLGTMPVSISLPARAPMDLVATLDGAAPRRVHLEANAAWQSDATGLRLDVPFALDASAGYSGTKWPAATNPTPLRASDAPRGLVRATSTPAGATLWLTVDASAIPVPCGAPVDLLIVSGNGQKPLHLEWSAFSGAPPRATTKL
ncbi:MAG: hypothetical protein ACXVEF_07965 [Polyangiales bacterium]